MPLAVFVPAKWNDLAVDVNVGTPAQGAVPYYSGTFWNALAAGTSGQFLKTLGAGANPVWASLPADTDTFAALTDVVLTSAAQGDVYYRNAAGNVVNLGPGTAGQVLTTGGAAANPSWTTVSGGGSLAGAVILAPNTVNRNLIQPTAATNKGLVIEAFAAQSANLFEAQLSTGVVVSSILPTGLFSSSQTTDSEQFGQLSNANAQESAAFGSNAAATGIGSTALGAYAVANQNNGQAIGRHSTASGTQSTAIGWLAAAGADGAVAIGSNAIASGVNDIGIGTFVSATAGQSVVIGRSAMVAVSGGVAMGHSASIDATSTNALAIGESASCLGPNSMALGAFSVANGYDTCLGRGASSNLASSLNRNVLVGYLAVTAGQMNVLVGQATTEGAAYSRYVAVGQGALIGGNQSIALGQGAITTAANQLVAGSNAAPLSAGYWGNGVTNAAPQAHTLNGTGGSGTNVAGAGVTLAGGKGTGTAKGGDVLVQTAPAGVSGTTLNPLATLAQFTGDSKIGLFGVTAVVRQTGGVATAGGSYTATEQGMLNRIYTALQAYGWLT